MMLGVSGLMGSSGDGSAATAAEAREGGGSSGCSGGGGGDVGGVGGFSEDGKGRIEEGERVSGGNRWPRQETLALLKIRSDMDVTFRDSSLKGPLWEEVSRKMAELGYHRSAKKCKEKFENVYKYHKRTKDGRASKPDGRTYRFFDQLEALESHPPFASPPPLPPPPRPQAPPITAVAMPAGSGPTTNTNTTSNPPPIVPPQVTVLSTANPTSQNTVTPAISPSPMEAQPLAMANPIQGTAIYSSYPSMPVSFMSNSASSSSTSSDDRPERRRKRKRKWKDFFERLMRDVIGKQEELQKKFLETLERRERDRVMREEAWRVQEMARMNREHDLLVQERSMAAAKDAALISFLQKFSDQQSPQIPISLPQMQVQIQVPENNPLPPPPQPSRPPTIHQQQHQTPPPAPPPPPVAAKNLDTPKRDNGGPPSSSRWPKAEVEALIKLRTSLDVKYQESGPKGPLWEEMSVAMRNLGYNRSSKRCKEKWENINKYFKKVKESNKKRPEDSKTCPYFHQLDAIYKEKAKTDGSYNPAGSTMKPDNPMVPIMVRPEQQWPLPPQEQHPMEEDESENMDQNHEDEDGDDDEDEDDDDVGGYEIVTNKPSSVPTTVHE